MEELLAKQEVEEEEEDEYYDEDEEEEEDSTPKISEDEAVTRTEEPGRGAEPRRQPAQCHA